MARPDKVLQQIAALQEATAATEGHRALSTQEVWRDMLPLMLSTRMQVTIPFQEKET